MKKFSNGKELGATPKSLLESFFFSFIGHMNILLIKGEIPGIQDAYKEFIDFDSNQVEIKSFKT